jgi:hypothetical protein
MSRRRLAATAAIAAVAVCASCNPFVDRSAAPMTVRPRDGDVTISRNGEELRVSGQFDLEAGDVVTVSGGDADIALAGRRRLVLGADGALVVRSETAVEALNGSLLIDAGDPTVAVVDEVRARAQGGVWRIDTSSVSSRVAVMRGTTTATAPGGQPVRVPALFQAPVVASEVFSPEPYRVDPRDEWDRQYLDGVIDLDDQLERFARALSGRLFGERPGPGYFEPLLGSDASLLADELRAGDVEVADLVVAAAIAASTDGASTPTALRRALGLFDDGATWGLTAAIMRVDPETMLARLEEFITAAVVSTSSAATSPGFEDAPESETRSDDDDITVTRGLKGGAPESPGDGCDNLIDCTLDILPVPQAE